MMRKYFFVRLVDDVVISQRAATTGGHVSLNHLPGAVFLGAVAARLYQKLSAAEQLTIFHSGRVRFATALPVTPNGCPGYPAPACWHYQKGELKDDRGILNHQHDRDTSGQPVQYRDEFFTHTGEFFTPKSDFRLKTAIDSKTGRTAESQLFGYTALLKGSLFWSKVEADAGSISAQRFDDIVDILQSDGVRLGRSRSAEYGRVKITVLEDDAAQKLELPEPQAAQEVSLWLLADAALQDEYGQPTLQPSGEAVGLSGFTLDPPAKTFVRATQYAPFNGDRKRRELERQVLLMGSVLHFRGDSPVSAEVLQGIQERGIGLYRQSGLGRVWVNPAWLRQAEPSFKPRMISLLSATSDKPPQSPSQNPLFRYLDQRKARASNAQEIEQAARQWANELKEVYRSALALEPHLSNICVGPSRNQWGRVRQVAQEKIQARQALPTLQKELFDGERAICKERDPQWSKRIFLSENQAEIDSFRAWFQQKIEQTQPSLELIARFARLASDVAEREGCKQEEETA